MTKESLNTLGRQMILRHRQLGNKIRVSYFSQNNLLFNRHKHVIGFDSSSMVVKAIINMIRTASLSWGTKCLFSNIKKC